MTNLVVFLAKLATEVKKPEGGGNINAVLFADILHFL